MAYKMDIKIYELTIINLQVFIPINQCLHNRWVQFSPEEV